MCALNPSRKKVVIQQKVKAELVLYCGVLCILLSLCDELPLRALLGYERGANLVHNHRTSVSGAAVFTEQVNQASVQ